MPLLLHFSSALPSSFCPPYAVCKVEVSGAPRGLCIGDVWIGVAPGETAERRDYPDATTYIVRLRTGRVLEITSGGPVVSPEPGVPTILVKDGEAIRRMTFDARNRSYRAAGLTFTGTVFDGSRADAAVFGRVRFGAATESLCRSTGG